MKEGKRICRLEDIPEELYQDIQSRLPVEEAARTSVLSKSWLQAWSTIRILRFPLRLAKLFSNNKEEEVDEEEEERERKQLEEMVDRTLMRYLRDNIPIESIDLSIDMRNHESASLAAEKWIRPVVTKSCLKQLSLSICVSRTYSFTLPPEILSSQNLTDINISCTPIISRIGSQMNPLSVSYPVIKCVSLRRLQLENVHISEEVLDDIFSVCRLTLVNVDLSYCTGFRTVKVQNLHRLYQFRITNSRNRDIVLEINDVPTIRLFTSKGIKTLPLMTSSSLGSVTKLWLGGMIIDDSFLHILQSKFPFLESLTLDMKLSTLKSFEIKCASMKILSLLSCPHMFMGVKVYSPKLVFFCFSGKTMPRLLFPAVTANVVLKEIQIEISLTRHDPMDDSFFLKMREAFTLSTKCVILIDVHVVPSDMNFDLDDLKRKVPFPARNVQRLTFRTISDEKSFWPEKCSGLFFDALFFICHPKHVVEEYMYNNNPFCKLIEREALMEKKKTRNNNIHWGDYLRDVEIRRCGRDEKWEILTNSWRSFSDGSADHPSGVEFKLHWHLIG